MHKLQAGFSPDYQAEPITIAQASDLPGLALLEFGAPWCGHCQAAEPAIAEALAVQARLRHLKIYDGRGKRLGRAFKVKLWPTLILLQDGEEVARLVRPTLVDQVLQLISQAPRPETL